MSKLFDFTILITLKTSIPYVVFVIYNKHVIDHKCPVTIQKNSSKVAIQKWFLFFLFIHYVFFADYNKTKKKRHMPLSIFYFKNTIVNITKDYFLILSNA